MSAFINSQVLSKDLNAEGGRGSGMGAQTCWYHMASLARPKQKTDLKSIIQPLSQ